MYRNKKISIVIPAYNEEKLIKPTLEHIPPLIDKIYVIDDASTDGMTAIVKEIARKDSRVELISHPKNEGPGQAIITGYLRSSKDGFDITVVVGGDFQMPLEQVEQFLDPLIDGQADYAKGNRFLLWDITREQMPRIRILGNIIITGLTKIASGYYKVMDVVDGYTAITKRAIETINWDNAWKKYGYPMDFLIRLNAYGFRVKDIARTPIYLKGERQSQIKGFRYALKTSPMLIRGFIWRMLFKYVYRDFHPLVFFFFCGLVFLPLGLLFGLYLIYLSLAGIGVSGPKAILCALLVLTGLQFVLFGMWFDMEASK
ncbi:MAG: glycosyltransferase family 2 protein [Candidatus Omnitrophota bacterium]